MFICGRGNSQRSVIVSEPKPDYDVEQIEKVINEGLAESGLRARARLRDRTDPPRAHLRQIDRDNGGAKSLVGGKYGYIPQEYVTGAILGFVVALALFWFSHKLK